MFVFVKNFSEDVFEGLHSGLPTVVLVDIGIAGLGYTVGKGGVVHESEDIVGESLRCITDEKRLSIGVAEGLSGKSGSDAGKSHRHGFEEFVLKAGAYAHGSHKYLRRRIGRANIVQRGLNGDSVAGQCSY